MPGHEPRAARTASGLGSRLLAALALLALAGTYVAAQIDFRRRHQPNQPWQRYWIPQITHIWLPGLGAAGGLALAAYVLHRRGQRDRTAAPPAERPADAPAAPPGTAPAATSATTSTGASPVPPVTDPPA